LFPSLAENDFFASRVARFAGNLCSPMSDVQFGAKKKPAQLAGSSECFRPNQVGDLAYAKGYCIQGELSGQPIRGEKSEVRKLLDTTP
jgi:hypothetical protein